MDTLRKLPQVAFSFKKAQQSGDGHQKAKRIFFVKVTLDFRSENQEFESIFAHQFNYSTIPWVNVIPEFQHEIVPHVKPIDSNHEWLVYPNEKITGPKIVAFVNKCLGTDVEYKQSFQQIVFQNLMIIGFFVVFLVMVFLLYNFLVIPFVWFVIANTIFLISIAGIAFNKTSGKPAFKRDDDGNPIEWIWRGHDSQYGVEGFMFSVMVVVAGLCLVVISRTHKITNDTILQRVIIYSCLYVIFYCYTKICWMYKEKSSWYDFTFWPGVEMM